jgi:hypothetical protein
MKAEHQYNPILRARKKKQERGDVSSRVAPVDVYLSNTGVVRRATSRHTRVTFGRVVSAGSSACHPRDPNSTLTTSNI